MQLLVAQPNAMQCVSACCRLKYDPLTTAQPSLLHREPNTDGYTDNQ